VHLIRLELNNYRRFEETVVEFPDGVIGIIGNNGAGKSSLVEAIAWVLYGNDVARSSKEEIKRLGATVTEACRVILDFESHGENYRVVRELKGMSNTADAAFFVNGKPQARGVTAVSELVDQTLGMDWKSFLVSFFARQRELNVLTEFQPAKRIEVLSRLLGIERIELAIKKLRQDKRDCQTKLETTRGFVVDTNLIQQQIQLKQNEKTSLSHKIGEQELQFKVARAELAQLEQEFNLLKTKRENFHHLQKEQEVKQSQLKLTEEQIASLQTEKEQILKLLPLQEELKPFLEKQSQLINEVVEQEGLRQKAATRKSIEEQIQAHQRLLEQDRQRLSILESELVLKPQIESESKAISEQLNRLGQQLNSAQNEYNHFSGEEKSLSDQLKKLRQQLDGIEKLGPESVCDRCLRPFGPDFDQIKTHIQGEMGKLAAQLSPVQASKETAWQTVQRLKADQEKSQKNKEDLQGKLLQLEQGQKEKTSLESRVSQSAMNLENFRRAQQELGTLTYEPERHQKLQQELHQAEQKKREYLQVSERVKALPQFEKKLHEAASRLSLLQVELKSLEGSLAHLVYNPELFLNQERHLEEQKQKAHQLELNLKDSRYAELTLNQQIQQLEQKITESRLVQKQIKELEEQSKYIEKLDLLLANFKIHLIGRIRPALSALTKNLFAEMTDGKYSDLELDEDYEIYVYDNGQKFGLERFSGGEKDLANLCLRLGISLLITQSAGAEFSFIVLDEIFGSQDQQRKENIIKALGNLRNRFRQILLITHIDDIKDQVEVLLNVAENQDGTSRVETSLAYD
jgi:exonuclease SbcC